MAENFQGAIVTIGGVDFRITASNEDMLRSLAVAENRTRDFNRRAAQHFRGVGVEAENAGKRIRTIGQEVEVANTRAARNLERLGGSIERILAIEALRRAASEIISINREAAQAQFALDATFAGGSARFTQIAQQRSAATGGLARSYQEAAVQFGTLAKNYGFATDQVEKLIRVSEDLAAVKGITVVQAAQRLQSAMRGEAEASEFLGLSLQSNAVKAFANMTDAQRQSFETLDQVTRGQIIYNEALRQSAYAQGAAEARARSGLGTYDRLTTQLDKLAQAFGKIAAPVALPFVEHTTTGLENINDLVQRMASAGPALQQVVGAMATVASVFGAIKLTEFIAGMTAAQRAAISLTGVLGGLARVAALVPNPIVRIVALGVAAFEAGNLLDKGLKELTGDYEALDQVSKIHVNNLARQAQEAAKLSGIEDELGQALTFFIARKDAIAALTEEQRKLNAEQSTHLKNQDLAREAEREAEIQAKERIQREREQQLQPFPKIGEDAITSLLRSLEANDQRVQNRFTKLGNASAVAFQVGLAGALGSDLMNDVLDNYIRAQGVEARKKFQDQVRDLRTLEEPLTTLETQRGEVISAERDLERVTFAMDAAQDRLAEFARKGREIDLATQARTRPLRQENIELDRAAAPLRQRLADIDRDIGRAQRTNFDLRRQELEITAQLVGPRRQVEGLERQITDVVNERLRLDREEAEIALELRGEPLSAQLRQLERAQRNARRSLDFAESEGEVANAQAMLNDLSRKQAQVQASLDPIRDRIEDIQAAATTTQRGERVQQIGLERQRLALVAANRPLEDRLKLVQDVAAEEAAARELVVLGAQEEREALSDLLEPIERRRESNQAMTEEIQRQHDERMLQIEAERAATDAWVIAQERGQSALQAHLRDLTKAYHDTEDAIVALLRSSNSFDVAEREAILARLGLVDRWKNALADVREEYRRIRQQTLADVEPDVFLRTRGRVEEGSRGPTPQPPVYGPPDPGVGPGGRIGGPTVMPGVTPGVVAPPPPPPAPTRLQTPTRQLSENERFRFLAEYFGFAASASRQINMPPELLLAIAALESGYGGSTLATEGGNLFALRGRGPAGSVGLPEARRDPSSGMTFVTSSEFQRFGNTIDSFEGFVQFLRTNPRFAEALQTTEPEDFVQALADAGYATDPDWQANVLRVLQDVRTSLQLQVEQERAPQLPPTPGPDVEQQRLVPGAQYGGSSTRAPYTVVGEQGPMMMSSRVPGYVLPNAVYNRMKSTRRLQAGGMLTGSPDEWAVVAEGGGRAPEIFVYGATSAAQAEAIVKAELPPDLSPQTRIRARQAEPGETPLSQAAPEAAQEAPGVLPSWRSGVLAPTPLYRPPVARTGALTPDREVGYQPGQEARAPGVRQSVRQRHDDGGVYVDTEWDNGTWTYEMVSPPTNVAGGYGEAAYGPAPVNIVELGNLQPPPGGAATPFDVRPDAGLQDWGTAIQQMSDAVVANAAGLYDATTPARERFVAGDVQGGLTALAEALPSPNMRFQKGGVLERMANGGPPPSTPLELLQWDEEVGRAFAQIALPQEFRDTQFRLPGGMTFSGEDLSASVLTPAQVPGIGILDVAGDLALKLGGRFAKHLGGRLVTDFGRLLSAPPAGATPGPALGIVPRQAGLPSMPGLAGRLTPDISTPEGQVEQFLLDQAIQQGTERPSVSAGDLFAFAQQANLPGPGVTRGGRSFPNQKTAGGHPQSLDDLRLLVEAGKPFSRWYEQFSRGIGQAVGPDNLNEALTIFGITSAQTSPENNLLYTLSIMRYLRELEDTGTSPWKFATAEDREEYLAAAMQRHAADPQRGGAGKEFSIPSSTPKVGDIIASKEFLAKVEGMSHVNMTPLDKAMVEAGATQTNLVLDKGRGTLTGGKLDAVAEAYATGFSEVGGAKTPSYVGNLASAFQAMYDPNTTIDTWIVQALGYVSKGEEGNDRIYRLAHGITKWLADEQGMAPHQAQAAMWFPIKALIDRGRLPGKNKYSKDIFGQLTSQFESGDIGIGDAVTQAIEAGLFETPPVGTWDEIITAPAIVEELLRAQSTVQGRPTQGLIGTQGVGLYTAGRGPGSIAGEPPYTVSLAQRALERAESYGTAPTVVLDMDRSTLITAGLNAAGRFDWLDIPHQVAFDDMGRAHVYLPGGQEDTARTVGAMLGRATMAPGVGVDLSRIGGQVSSLGQREYDSMLQPFLLEGRATPEMMTAIEVAARSNSERVGQPRFPGMPIVGDDAVDIGRVRRFAAGGQADEAMAAEAEVLSAMLRNKGVGVPPGYNLSPGLLQGFIGGGFAGGLAEQQREGSTPGSVWQAMLLGSVAGIGRAQAGRALVGRGASSVAADIFRQGTRPNASAEQVERAQAYLREKFGVLRDPRDMIRSDEGGFAFGGGFVDKEGVVYPFRGVDGSNMDRYHASVARDILRDQGMTGDLVDAIEQSAATTTLDFNTWARTGVGDDLSTKMAMERFGLMALRMSGNQLVAETGVALTPSQLQVLARFRGAYRRTIGGPEPHISVDAHGREGDIRNFSGTTEEIGTELQEALMEGYAFEATEYAAGGQGKVVTDLDDLFSGAGVRDTGTWILPDGRVVWFREGTQPVVGGVPHTHESWANRMMGQIGMPPGRDPTQGIRLDILQQDLGWVQLQTKPVGARGKPQFAMAIQKPVTTAQQNKLSQIQRTMTEYDNELVRYWALGSQFGGGYTAGGPAVSTADLNRQLREAGMLQDQPAGPAPEIPGALGIIPTRQVRRQMAGVEPDLSSVLSDPNATAAVRNTPNTSIAPDGILINLERWQKPEIGGLEAPRGAVFYSAPDIFGVGSMHQTTPDDRFATLFGGPEGIKGKTLLRRPLAVEARAGGEIGAKVMQALGLGDQYESAVKAWRRIYPQTTEEQFEAYGLGRKVTEEQKLAEIERILTEAGGDPSKAELIAGMQPYVGEFALRENIMATNARAAGYDSILGYTNVDAFGRATARPWHLREVVDLREVTNPQPGVPGEIHPQFLSLMEDRRAVERLLSYTEGRTSFAGSLEDEGEALSQLFRERGYGVPEGDTISPDLAKHLLGGGAAAGYSESQREGSTPESVWGAALLGAPAGVLRSQIGRRIRTSQADEAIVAAVKGGRPSPEEIARLQAEKAAAKAAVEAEKRARLLSEGPPAPFYSALKRRIQTAMPEKTTAEAVGRLLQGSVSGNERRFSRIDAWLAGHAGEQVTRSEVMQFLDEQPLALVDIARGFPGRRTAPVNVELLRAQSEALDNERNDLFVEFSRLDEIALAAEKGGEVDPFGEKYVSQTTPLRDRLEEVDRQRAHIREQITYAGDPHHITIPYEQQRVIDEKRAEMELLRTKVRETERELDAVDVELAGYTYGHVPAQLLDRQNALLRVSNESQERMGVLSDDIYNLQFAAQDAQRELPTSYGPGYGSGTVLPGGREDTYRELLLQVPPLPRALNLNVDQYRRVQDAAFSHPDAYDKIGYGGGNSGQELWHVPGDRDAPLLMRSEGRTGRVRWRVPNDVVSRIPNYTTSFDTMADAVEAINQSSSPTWTHGHWNEENVLAWARWDERDIGGKNTLFVQEFQSDWIQQGRDKGFKPTAVEAQALEKRLAELKDLVGPADLSAMDITDAAGRGDYMMNRLEMLRTERRLKSEVPVPPITESSEYVDLMVKRLIRYAADNNFEQIAWTTGQTQADRWNLSKVASKITWEPETYNQDSGMLRVVGPNGNTVMDRSVKLVDLENYIGAETTERLMRAPGYQYEVLPLQEAMDKGWVFPEINVAGRREGRYVALATNVAPTAIRGTGGRYGGMIYDMEEGAQEAAEHLEEVYSRWHALDMDATEIGGAVGMQQAYDVTAKNIFERHTGAKARMGQTSQGAADYDVVYDSSADEWMIIDNNADPYDMVAGPFSTPEEGQNWILNYAPERAGVPVHVIDIPEEVRRRAIEEGFAGYAKGGLFQAGQPMMVHNGELIMPNLPGMVVPHDLTTDLLSSGGLGGGGERHDTLTIVLPETLNVPDAATGEAWIRQFIEVASERWKTVDAAGVRVRRR